jgi:hypothetical protein
VPFCFSRARHRQGSGVDSSPPAVTIDKDESGKSGKREKIFREVIEIKWEEETKKPGRVKSGGNLSATRGPNPAIKKPGTKLPPSRLIKGSRKSSGTSIIFRIKK